MVSHPLSASQCAFLQGDMTCANLRHSGCVHVCVTFPAQISGGGVGGGHLGPEA